MNSSLMSVLSSSPTGAAGLTSLSALQYKAKNQSPEAQRQNQAKVCAEVEGVFLTQLMQQMHKTLVASVNPRQKKDSEYSHLYEQRVAQALASGGGIGLARSLFDNLQNRQSKIPHSGKESQNEPIRTESPDPAGDFPLPGTPGMSGTGSPGPVNSPGGNDPEPGRF